MGFGVAGRELSADVNCFFQWGEGIAVPAGLGQYGGEVVQSGARAGEFAGIDSGQFPVDLDGFFEACDGLVGLSQIRQPVGAAA